MRLLNIKKLTTYLVLLILIVLCTVLVINTSTNTYFTIKFEELEPFESRMPIYYKGFKVGHTIKTIPNDEFTHTHIKSVITYKNIKFPLNTTALVRRRSKKFYYDVQNYIELQTPTAPDIKHIENGSIITGKNSETLETILTKHIENGNFDEIAQEFKNLLVNLNSTTNALIDIFVMLNDILAENRPNILQASSNLASTTYNIHQFSEKFNNSLSQDGLTDTFNNTNLSSENIEKFTKNLNEISEYINEFMPKIDSTIMNANTTMCNTSKISEGILQTLKRRMGFMKLLFGKTVKNQCNSN